MKLFLKILELLSINKSYKGNSIKGFCLFMLSTFDGIIIIIMTFLYWLLALLMYTGIMPKFKSIEPIVLLAVPIFAFFGLFLRRSHGFSPCLFGIIYAVVYYICLFYIISLPFI